MTRRRDKQVDSAFYVPDGDAGTVWTVDAEDDDPWSLSIWATQQTAEQYADWLVKAHNLSYPPRAWARTISTRMKNIT